MLWLVWSAYQTKILAHLSKWDNLLANLLLQGWPSCLQSLELLAQALLIDILILGLLQAASGMARLTLEYLADLLLLLLPRLPSLDTLLDVEILEILLQQVLQNCSRCQRSDTHLEAV